jgi:hypothetical protein
MSNPIFQSSVATIGSVYESLTTMVLLLKASLHPAEFILVEMAVLESRFSLTRKISRSILLKLIKYLQVRVH